MKNIFSVFIMAFLFSISTNAQNEYSEPFDEWHRNTMRRNEHLIQCTSNIGLFPKGFYWVDLHGHTWYYEANPYHDGSSEDIRLAAICTVTFVPIPYEELREAYLAERGRNLREYYELHSYSYTHPSNEPDPPVFRQNDTPYYTNQR